jgi:hypothetical protein
MSFLRNNQAAIVDGPTSNGFYRVRVAPTSMIKSEVTRIVLRLRQDRVVDVAEAD